MHNRNLELECIGMDCAHSPCCMYIQHSCLYGSRDEIEMSVEVSQKQNKDLSNKMQRNPPSQRRLFGR